MYNTGIYKKEKLTNNSLIINALINNKQTESKPKQNDINRTLPKLISR
jgi:hypothetical protein